MISQACIPMKQKALRGEARLREAEIFLFTEKKKDDIMATGIKELIRTKEKTMNELMKMKDYVMTGPGAELADKAESFLSQNSGLMIFGIVLGVLVCLFGLKLIRVFAALSGFAAGLGIGVIVSFLAGTQGTTSMIIIFACAIVLAVLAAWLYRLGVFIWALYAAAGASVAFIQPQSKILLLVCGIIGLIVAILTVVFLDPLIIILTALAGGTLTGLSLGALLGLDPLIAFGIGLAVAVIGIIVQFMMKSREVGKKERIHSEKYKEEASMESEVERARRLLKEVEDDEEDYSDEDEAAEKPAGEKKAKKAKKKSAKAASPKKEEDDYYFDEDEEEDGGLDDDIKFID